MSEECKYSTFILIKPNNYSAITFFYYIFLKIINRQAISINKESLSILLL